MLLIDWAAKAIKTCLTTTIWIGLHVCIDLSSTGVFAVSKKQRHTALHMPLCIMLAVTENL